MDCAFLTWICYRSMAEQAKVGVSSDLPKSSQICEQADLSSGPFSRYAQARKRASYLPTTMMQSEPLRWYEG